MPFVIKDVLQHKRNDRQKREIHEREYLKYLTNLRQQQQQKNSSYTNQYYLPLKHLNEIERSHIQHEIVKQNQYNRIENENHLLYERLLKARKRTMIDDKNQTYEQNLTTFISKRYQQRCNEYNRIYNDNQILLQRLNNARGNLITKQKCDNDWKNHIEFMKKNCDYPENIDKFITTMNKNEQKQANLYSLKRIIQWNDRHFINEPSKRLTIMPLSMLLNES
ncbi:unnamed protein product [Rotaria sordida]|uniref:Uncharacterized protein n=1 Tax=Rotaria sordida TaxID=392033 RepID=A0A814KKJ9_9BILA|nr:unnamed protein product [Rotaria sordida]CAF3642905.1 unnamed protein product [Rotaria sordida]